MMGYLDRLKAEVLEKQAVKELPKPPKAPYGSFDSSQGGHFQEIEANAATLAELEAAANRLCDACEGDAAARAEMLAGLRAYPPKRWSWLAEYLNGEAERIKLAAREAETQDDRRRCTNCANYASGGRCLADWRGELSGMVSRRYSPAQPERLRRCEGYAPGADDPDRRHGRERWPGLIQKGGE